MRIYDLADRGNLSLYESLYRHIRDDILAGFRTAQRRGRADRGDIARDGDAILAGTAHGYDDEGRGRRDQHENERDNRRCHNDPYLTLLMVVELLETCSAVPDPPPLRPEAPR